MTAPLRHDRRLRVRDRPAHGVTAPVRKTVEEAEWLTAGLPGLQPAAGGPGAALLGARKQDACTPPPAPLLPVRPRTSGGVDGACRAVAREGERLSRVDGAAVEPRRRAHAGRDLRECRRRRTDREHSDHDHTDHAEPTDQEETPRAPSASDGRESRALAPNSRLFQVAVEWTGILGTSRRCVKARGRSSVVSAFTRHCQDSVEWQLRSDMAKPVRSRPSPRGCRDGANGFPTCRFGASRASVGGVRIRGVVARARATDRWCL